MADCLIGLGSNLDDRAALLDQAAASFCDHPQITPVASSQHYRTRPVGGPKGQSDFLNSVVRVTSSLTAHELLERSLLVEQQLGRERIERWAQRRIDIDLLLYDQVQLQTDRLTLPHPRMAYRRFVLSPACEVAGEMVHPNTGRSLQQLLTRLDEMPRYIALAGIPGAGRTALAASIARAWPSRDLIVIKKQDLTSQRVGEARQASEGSRGISNLGLRILQPDCLRQQPVAEGRQVGYLLSDFWLPEAASLAKTRRDHEFGAESLAVWRDAVWRDVETWLPEPHLILFLDTPVEVAHRQLVADTSDSPGDGLLELLSVIRDAMAMELRITRKTPVITVSSCNLEAAEVELKAAMDAMRDFSENPSIHEGDDEQ